MTTSDLILFGGALALVIAWAVVWFGIGYVRANEKRERWWRDEMVKRGHARYHFYDGQWCWIEDLPAHDKAIADPAAAKVKNIMTFKSASATATLEK